MLSHSNGFHDLHVASYEGDISEVRRLLAHGAYVNAQDARGLTPLHFAMRRKHHARSDAVAAVLRAAGASDDIRDSLGRTASDVFRQYSTSESYGGPLRQPLLLS